jgi:hypothetical protein
MADFNWPGAVRFSSYCTVASPVASDTFASATPFTALSARVTVLVQPPQLIPVTFRCSVCIVGLLSNGEEVTAIKPQQVGK